MGAASHRHRHRLRASCEPKVSKHVSMASGFRGARLLVWPDGQEVMYTSIAFFTSLDAWSAITVPTTA